MTFGARWVKFKAEVRPLNAFRPQHPRRRGKSQGGTRENRPNWDQIPMEGGEGDSISPFFRNLLGLLWIGKCKTRLPR